MDEQLDKILKELRSQTLNEKEDMPSDEECTFENCDPDEYTPPEEEHEEDYSAEDRYNDWVNDTYSGEEYVESLESVMVWVQDAISRLQNDDYRYYAEQDHNIEELVSKIYDIADQLDSESSNFVTLEDYE
jgi:hypothetical protein